MNNCVYPALPLPAIGTPGSYDTRSFKVGEPVCLRNQEGGDITTGTYVRAHPQPGTGLVYTHIIRSEVPGLGPRDRWIPWQDVGKILQPVSATAANVVVRSSPLPLHLASVIKKYGGGKRKSRRTVNRKKISLRSKASAKRKLSSRKKLKSRRRSRRN